MATPRGMPKSLVSEGDRVELSGTTAKGLSIRLAPYDPDNQYDLTPLTQPGEFAPEKEALTKDTTLAWTIHRGDGDFVGFTYVELLTLFSNPYGRLSTFVHPQARGQGISILSHILLADHMLRQDRTPPLWNIETQVAESNTASIRANLAAGYNQATYKMVVARDPKGDIMGYRFWKDNPNIN